MDESEQELLPSRNNDVVLKNLMNESEQELPPSPNNDMVLENLMDESKSELSPEYASDSSDYKPLKQKKTACSVCDKCSERKSRSDFIVSNSVVYCRKCYSSIKKFNHSFKVPYTSRSYEKKKTEKAAIINMTVEAESPDNICMITEDVAENDYSIANSENIQGDLLSCVTLNFPTTLISHKSCIFRCNSYLRLQIVPDHIRINIFNIIGFYVPKTAR